MIPDPALRILTGLILAISAPAQDLPDAVEPSHEVLGAREFSSSRVPYVLSLLLLQAASLGGWLLARARLRRSQGDLDECRRQMAFAASAGGMASWVWDIPRDEVLVPAEGRALLGLPPEQPMSLDRLCDVAHPDDRDTVRHRITAMLGGVGEGEIRWRIAGPHGTRWITTHGRVELADDGRPGRLRAVSRDVTDVRQADAELHRQRADLAHVTRVASLGALATSLAHELNQPLTAILSNAQAALHILAADATDRDMLREILKDITAEDIRAGEIIRRLRALVRKEEPAHEAVDLGRVIRDVTALVRSEAAVQRVAVRLVLPERLPAGHGDPVQLQQVVLNLVLNAMDAMRTCPEAEREITIEARSAGEMIEVTVRDRGTGLDPNRSAYLFLPFHSTKPNGLGMGLSISKAIIEAHGGAILAANSPDGRGAIFCFTVPRGDPSPQGQVHRATHVPQGAVV